MKLTSADESITVQSSSVQLGDTLPKHARDEILRVAAKYFGRLNTAAVHFSKEGITYRCSVSMHMGSLPVRSAEAQDKDIYAAFKIALGKVSKQLRRAKRQIREDKGERVDKDSGLQDGLRPLRDPER